MHLHDAVRLPTRLRLLPRTAALALALLAAGASAYTGETRVYGTQYAYNNNFNDSNNNIKGTFGSGSTPSLTVSYNLPSGQLYGYPAICRGWHYTMNPTTDSYFPHQVSKIGSLSGALAFTTNGSGQTGDFAYDLFFRKDASKGNPQLEVMIWGANNSYPIGTVTTANAITSGGVTYDLWEGNNPAAGYYVYTFIPHGRQQQSTAGQGQRQCRRQGIPHTLAGPAGRRWPLQQRSVSAGGGRRLRGHRRDGHGVAQRVDCGQVSAAIGAWPGGVGQRNGAQLACTGCTPTSVVRA
ncbi:hypothetical protein FHR51_001840 [Xanthomonas arboricola]|nr:hypothetical protein [Xanthomonas cannabis]